MASKHISLPSSFVAGDPTEWFTRFEICCNANEWSDVVKARKLPTLLEGEALAVWMELSEADKESYQRAKAEMITRMAPVRFVSLGDFHGRRLHLGEPLSVFLHVLKRLLDQAMPEADAATRNQLLIHQFLTGLPTHVSRQLRAAGEIDDLDKLLERAKLLLTIEEPGKTAAAVEATIPAEVAVLQEQISALTEQVAALVTRRTAIQPAMPRLCYRCHQPGHLQRNCPDRRRCYSCGQPGHLARECESGNDRGTSRMGRGRSGRQ